MINTPKELPVGNKIMAEAIGTGVRLDGSIINFAGKYIHNTYVRADSETGYTPDIICIHSAKELSEWLRALELLKAYIDQEGLTFEGESQ